MDGDPVEAVVAAAADGVDFDGLAVRAGPGGYAVETPAEAREGLDEDGLRAVAAESPYVTNWYFWHAVAPQAEPRWAFCRWVEGADDRPVPDRHDALAAGVTREWGQLRIEAGLDGDGGRVYDLRHVDDAGVPASDLTAHGDPLDAREVGKRDERGRYRPLRTAPTLRTGWTFPDLGPAGLVEAVEAFYPATVPNWYREREGDLDVSHWRETMERQTGMYGLIETWDRGEGSEHVEWVAEACCDDSQCLKRREWEYDAETTLGVDGGDGSFPCREPCSVVVSAARRWTRLEAEGSRTYEFELTPSEKEQVEAVIDAVADGRAEAVREADFKHPANRWRTRFLRAKRFDGAGNLSGTPTDPDGDGDGDGDE